MAEDRFRNTITLRDAEKISGPLAFNVMVKPGGSLCNLDCRYCYYLDKSALYGGREPKMDEETLETVIKNYIESCDVPEVTFNWHGGEPLAMGLDFYRKAAELERKYAGGKRIMNTLQTNGTLLNGQWADFFAKNGWLIGISVDGPKPIHDRYRSSKAGEPTFDRVMAGLRQLVYGGVEFNTLTALSKASEGHGLEIYQFLKSIGSHYMQFLPVSETVRYPLSKKGKPDKGARPVMVEPRLPANSLPNTASSDNYGEPTSAGYSSEEAIGSWSISGIGYGKILCEVYDYWVRNDVGRYYVGIFDATLACLCGVKPGTCIYEQTCGDNAVVEHNGDVYVCDHFVYPRHRLGNVKDASLREMLTSPQAVAFGINKRNSLPGQCRRCEWLSLCNGECPKHRFAKTDKGEPGLNSLCDGLRMFYRHTASDMRRMKELLSLGKPPALIMLEKR